MPTSPYAMVRSESPHAWVTRTVSGLIDPVLRRARRPHRGRDETIHLLRTTSKQLRALLRLLQSAISPSTFEAENARLRAAADRLAPDRERAVARKILKRWEQDTGDRHKREILRQLGRRLDAMAPQSSSGDPIRAIGESAGGLRESKRALLLVTFTNGGDTIREGLIATYRRARRRMKTALDPGGDETLHRWRIAVKRLYYQLRWLEPVWPKRFPDMIEGLHQLEEKLGTEHDLASLQQWLQRQSGLTDGFPSPKWLHKAISQRRQQLKQRSLALGSELFSLTTRGFEKRCRRRWEKWQERAPPADSLGGKPTTPPQGGWRPLRP